VFVMIRDADTVGTIEPRNPVDKLMNESEEIETIMRPFEAKHVAVEGNG